tara:strand:- start:294 stop:1307 length:1014 start_codon:yes stop_codon:yes gene_type:complete
MDSLNGTIFNYSADIIYFDSFSNPAIYATLFAFCLVSFAISTGMLGCSIYSPDIDHHNEFYGEEVGPQWNAFAADLKRKKQKRSYIHFVWGVICAYLLYMTYATYMYSFSKEILTPIQASMYDNSVPCSENPDVTCCTYYDECVEGDSGPAGPMDASTYIIGAYTEGGNAECPRILDIIDTRDTLMEQQWSIPCEHTEHGCCMVDTLCDSYIRQEEPYLSFQSSINWRQTRARRGKVMTAIAKIDAAGTNCGDESVLRLLTSYGWELINNIPVEGGGRSQMQSYDYLLENMRFATAGILGFCLFAPIAVFIVFRKNTHEALEDAENSDEDWSPAAEP